MSTDTGMVFSHHDSCHDSPLLLSEIDATVTSLFFAELFCLLLSFLLGRSFPGADDGRSCEAGACCRISLAQLEMAVIVFLFPMYGHGA
jgi:hypothetical protein